MIVGFIVLLTCVLYIRVSPSQHLITCRKQGVSDGVLMYHQFCQPIDAPPCWHMMSCSFSLLHEFLFVLKREGLHSGRSEGRGVQEQSFLMIGCWGAPPRVLIYEQVSNFMSTVLSNLNNEPMRKSSLN